MLTVNRLDAISGAVADFERQTDTSACVWIGVGPRPRETYALSITGSKEELDVLARFCAAVCAANNAR